MFGLDAFSHSMVHISGSQPMYVFGCRLWDTLESWVPDPDRLVQLR